MDPDRILLLMGPTGIGKTQLAMDLQDALGGPSKAQLISVDSAMIYRGMDIGTAKPTKDALLRYPHDLVDILDPSQPYSYATSLNETQLEPLALYCAFDESVQANARPPVL